MTNQTAIYDAAKRAAGNAHIYLIMRDGQKIGRVVFKYNKTNTACDCWLWVQGAGIAKGRAGGGGYDRMSAAARKAALALPATESIYDSFPRYAETRALVVKALDHDDGYNWERRLNDAGLYVESVI